jgi:hypothetical protein
MLDAHEYARNFEHDLDLDTFHLHAERAITRPTLPMRTLVALGSALAREHRTEGGGMSAQGRVAGESATSSEASSRRLIRTRSRAIA